MDILAVILLNVLALPIQELLSELLGVPQLPDLWLIFIVSVICWIVKYRKKFLTKQSWTSDIWIVEVSDKFVIYLWVFYLIVQTMKRADIFDNLLTVVLEWTNWIDLSLFPKPVESLLGLTIIFVALRLWYHQKIKKKLYKPLNKDEFPEYDFDFQSNLVKFLNSYNQFGQNIYWLDGAWGTGKTYFIRTFFEKQSYKAREIYYISCFGIKTRSQAEQVLLSEIEARSRLGIFSNIPVIGSLISWGFNASGLGLMKKDAILIFDDLERVVYNPVNNENGTEDNPADYNDLLGFIDYLANHKNQKVIVLYNKKDMSNTKEKIIENKFGAFSNCLPLHKEILDKIISIRQLDELTKVTILKLFELVIEWNVSYNLRKMIHFLGKCDKNGKLNDVLWKFWSDILLKELRRNSLSDEDTKIISTYGKNFNFLFFFFLYNLNFPDKDSRINILLDDYRERLSFSKIRKQLSKECDNNSSRLIDYYFKDDMDAISKLGHSISENEMRFIYGYLSPKNIEVKQLFKEKFKKEFVVSSSNREIEEGYIEHQIYIFYLYFEYIKLENDRDSEWLNVFKELKEELNKESKINIFDEIGSARDYYAPKYLGKLGYFPSGVCENLDTYRDSRQYYD